MPGFGVGLDRVGGHCKSEFGDQSKVRVGSRAVLVHKT